MKFMIGERVIKKGSPWGRMTIRNVHIDVPGNPKGWTYECLNESRDAVYLFHEDNLVSVDKVESEVV